MIIYIKNTGARPKFIGKNNTFSKPNVFVEKDDINSIKDTYPVIYLCYKTTLEGMFKCDLSDIDDSCGI